MSIAKPKLFGLFTVLIGSLALTGFVLYNSIIPQYSMAELFRGEVDPNSLVGNKIQVVGDVSMINENDFVITDWDGLNLSLVVECGDLALPAGFELGKRVMVEGELQTEGMNFTLVASLVSTKCPSKYVTES